MPHYFKSIDQLLAFLGLDAAHSPYRIAGRSGYPFRVSTAFAAAMRKSDWHDPLLLQVLPRQEEERTDPGRNADPVGDHAAMRAPGLLQKYRGRVLLYVTDACAVNCRFCFRKEFGSSGLPHSRTITEATWRWIESDPSISEVILSGGDPLMIAPDRIEGMLRRLASVDHVRVVRIHTRVPVADPERVSDRLLSAISRLCGEKRVVAALHVNHVAELHNQCRRALDGLRSSGAMLLGQSVLLAGINDDPAPLIDLCRGLVDYGVMPGYLHQLDRARGTGHFEVPVSRGKRLIAALRRELPGYAVPRYLQEIAGRKSKTVLA